MSQLQDVIYVPNDEKYSTANIGTHQRYSWDEATGEDLDMSKYTEYYVRYRIEAFIREFAPELEDKLKVFLDGGADVGHINLI